MAKQIIELALKSSHRWGGGGPAADESRRLVDKGRVRGGDRRDVDGVDAAAEPGKLRLTSVKYLPSHATAFKMRRVRLTLSE